MANKRLTNREFINKCKKVHGEKYDYSLCKYTLSKNKVTIICPKHGPFSQEASHHKKGGDCPKCAKNIATIKKRSTTEEFIKKALLVHKNKYDYSRVQYVTLTKKVEIICPDHGKFLQTPGAHLNGQGCRKCGMDRISKFRRYSTEEFVHKSKQIHGDNYDYSKVKYKSSQEKVNILCHQHGMFTQTPSSHLKGSGCPKCLSFGWYSKSMFEGKEILSNTIGRVYLLELSYKDEKFLKVGISKNKISYRYNRKTTKPYVWKLIKEIELPLPQCYSLEQKIIRQDFIDNKYTPLIPIDGRTECLNYSIKENIIKYLENYSS